MQKTAVLGCLGVLVLGAVILLLTGIGGYNSLVGLSTAVDGKWAQVQAQYQRRADLVPNLVHTVEGSANFEKSTLEAVTNARASATRVNIDPSHAPTDPEQLAAYQKAQEQLSGSLARLLVSVEKYPDLKTTTAFRDLQAQLEGTENRITVARNDFNTSVQAYNRTRQSFPAVLYGNVFGFPRERPYFKADEGAQNAPTVNFGSFNNSPTPAATPH